MKVLMNPWVWGAAAVGAVVAIMATDGQFGADVQAVAIHVRNAVRITNPAPA